MTDTDKYVREMTDDEMKMSLLRFFEDRARDDEEILGFASIFFGDDKDVMRAIERTIIKTRDYRLSHIRKILTQQHTTENGND